MDGQLSLGNLLSFEDNSGALAMARLPKMRPRTKHLCVKLHHFREFVRTKRCEINKIPSEFQLADIGTKPQPETLFVAQREALMQWDSEFKTREELSLPTNHLRCDIVEQHEKLCEEDEDQKADVVRTSTSRHGVTNHPSPR